VIASGIGLATLPDMSQQEPSGDWVSQLVGVLDRTVSAVRDRTTRPAILVVRALVYGVLAAVLGLFALILLAVALVRIVVLATQERVWLADLIVGMLFCIVGLFFWMRRHVKPAD
jgi:hypothetical protein